MDTCEQQKKSARLIEWVDGYPTEESLDRLRAAVNGQDFEKAVAAFYSALSENIYGACGVERKEVRGEVIDVWAYHTLGWSGNESVIAVLQASPLWAMVLERYDNGGHYYFKLLCNRGGTLRP